MEQDYEFNEQTENVSEKTWMLTPRMRSVNELLKDGWTSLDGHWGNALLLILVWVICIFGVELIQYVLNMIIAVVYVIINGTQVTKYDQLILKLLSYPIAILFSIFVSYPLSYGLSNAFVRAKRAKTSVAVSDLFLAKDQYFGVVGTGFFVGLYTLLWSLLFLIPGIYKGLAYSMSVFIRHDHPELTANECIDLSEDMMDGHKLDLFCIVLVFIVLSLLSFLTCCIGFFFTLPYMYSILAEFYEDVKAEYEYNQWQLNI